MKYSIAFTEHQQIDKAVSDIYEQIDKENLRFLLYFSDAKRFTQITQEITKTFPNIQTIGASSYIIFTSKGNSKKGLAALALYNDSKVVTEVLPDISVFPLQYIQNIINCASNIDKNLKPICFEVSAAFQNGEERVLDTLQKGFSEVFSDSIEIFGGTAGNEGENDITYVAKDGEVFSKACVFALLCLPMQNYINREDIYTPTKSVLYVTEANPIQRTIYEIDKIPAIEAIANSCEIPPSELPKHLSNNPLGHIIGNKQYLIEPVSFNKDGSISFFAQVFKHSKIAIFKEKKTQEVFLETEMKVKKEVPNPVFSIVVNCLARTKHFEELKCLNDFFQSLSHYTGDFIGFSGYGEQYNSHHFNQSLITSTFSNNSKKEIKSFTENRIDNLTGLYNQQGFIDNCIDIINQNADTKYVICICNINNFRVVNDIYGFEKGDETLKFIASSLKKFMKESGVCTRVYSNSFALCIPYTIEYMDEFSKIKYFEYSIDEIPYQLTIRSGMFSLDDLHKVEISSSDIKLAIEYALIAQSQVKITSVNTFYFYNSQMHERMISEVEITNKMREALNNNEFQIYFQPQYNHINGALVGAEALCRWIKSDGKIVKPDSFIPVFEKNGFIQDLDKYIWNKTFQIIASWIKQQLDPVPISINISRISLRNPGLAQYFSRLAILYNIPPKLIHLEFTESSYMDNQEQIIATAKDLQKEGFLIAMDDFGSGYSSLNTLKELPIDILKFDMGFIKDTNNTKTGIILNCLVRMAQNLNLITIVEGVEDLTTADYLRSIGSDIIQGYLYSKALPQKDYEKVLSSAKKVEIKQVVQKKQIDINNFFSPNSLESTIFDNYVGAAAVLNYSNGKIEILRINKAYLSEIGLDGKSGIELQKNFTATLTPESKANYIQAIEETIKTKEMSICITERKINKRKHSIWIKSQFWCISSLESRSIIYVLVDNVSELKNTEQRAIERQAQMETIVENTENGICLFSIKPQGLSYETQLLYVNKSFCDITHYSKAEMLNFTTKDFLNIVDLKDRTRFLSEISTNLLKSKHIDIAYYAWSKNGIKHHVKLAASMLPQKTRNIL